MKYILIKDNKVVKLTHIVTEKDLDKYKPDFVVKGDKVHTLEINGDIIKVEYCNLLDLNKFYIITNISNDHIESIIHTLHGSTFSSLDKINQEIVSRY